MVVKVVKNPSCYRPLLADTRMSREHNAADLLVNLRGWLGECNCLHRRNLSIGQFRTLRKLRLIRAGFQLVGILAGLGGAVAFGAVRECFLRGRNFAWIAGPGF